MHRIAGAAIELREDRKRSERKRHACRNDRPQMSICR
jgi:hypothetical protein